MVMLDERAREGEVAFSDQEDSVAGREGDGGEEVLGLDMWFCLH